jgi:hypothetical protein
MELEALVEFTIQGDNGHAEVILGFNKNWQFTKKIKFYDWEGKLSRETKWATTQRILPEDMRNQSGEVLQDLKEKSIKRISKIL